MRHVRLLLACVLASCSGGPGEARSLTRAESMPGMEGTHTPGSMGDRQSQAAAVARKRGGWIPGARNAREFTCLLALPPGVVTVEMRLSGPAPSLESSALGQTPRFVNA